MDVQPASSQAGARSVADLAPTPYNPRKPWGEGRGDAFKRSLIEFGDLSGIVLNVETGNLVGGNKRTDVFREAKESRIVKTEHASDAQGTVAHGYVIADGNRFAYREVRWPLAKEKAANLAANKWSAEWQWEDASKLLQELNADVDLSLTGFESHELDALLAADWKPAVAESMQEHSHHNSVHLVLTNEQHALFEKAKAKAIHDGAAQEITDGEVVALMVEVYLNAQ